MPDTRDRVFDRITVDHMARGTVRVHWSLYYDFAAPGPHSFQLQVGRTGLATADDWANVGAPVVDGTTATDATPRLAGTSMTTHYRVVLTDGDGEVYRSRPAGVYGLLGLRDWLLASELVRKHKLLQRRFAGVPGWLLKRRLVGTPAAQPTRRSTKVDPMTGGLIRSQGAGMVATGGTEFGYFAPTRLDVDMPGGGSAAEVDPARGTYDEAVDFPGCGFLVLPYVDAGDLFVADGSDRRFAVGAVQVNVSLRGVPLYGTATLSLLPFSDVAYKITVPEAP